MTDVLGHAQVLQGALLALIRSAEDSQLIHRWYGEAVSVKKDGPVQPWLYENYINHGCLTVQNYAQKLLFTSLGFLLCTASE